MILIIMSVPSQRFVTTVGAVITPMVPSTVLAFLVMKENTVKSTTTTVILILVKMVAHVLTALTIIHVFVLEASVVNIVRTTSMNVHPTHVGMELCVQTMSIHIPVLVVLVTAGRIVRMMIMTVHFRKFIFW